MTFPPKPIAIDGVSSAALPGFSSDMVVQVDQENLNFEPILEIPNMGGNIPTVSTYRKFSNQPYATTYHCSWFCLSPYLEYHIKQIDKELAKFDSVELSKKGQGLSNSFIPFHTQPNSNILVDDNVSDASFASYDHLIEEVKYLT